MSELKIPTFQSEDEEAEWYQAHESEIMADFAQRAAAGTLSRGTAKRANTQPVTIRLDIDDLALAKSRAAARGLAYQTYLKSVLHVALSQEEELAR